MILRSAQQAKAMRRCLSGQPGAQLAVLPDMAALRAWRDRLDVESVQKHGRLARLGFVPTMGALHAGHLSLVESLRDKTDHTLVSIFVNPAQFAAHEDLGTYPRTLESDLAKLGEADLNVAAVFTPTEAEMYQEWPPYRTFVEPLEADDSAEGRARPGFFRGVATVVTKLFAAARPTVAAFGQKDAYQCIVVRQLARDLNLGVDVQINPTTREQDGLAMSSRNAYLTVEEREAAPAMYAALREVQRIVGRGLPWGVEELRTIAADALSDRGRGRFGPLQYLDVACAATGRPVVSSGESHAEGGAVLVSIAAPLGRTRLIDNMVIVPDKPSLDETSAVNTLGR